MIGIYFSGTGYTKYCVESFVKNLDENCEAFSIESINAIEYIAAHEIIVFGYPIYYSRLPGIVEDFIVKNKDKFRSKKIFIISTQGTFSGDDSAGCAARLFLKYGSRVVGGLHLKMPNNTADDKRYVTGSAIERNRRIEKAKEKILISVNKYKEGKPTREGLSFYRRFVGFWFRIIQKLWFLGKTNKYMKMPDVQPENCTGCGLCKKLCPMQNIEIINSTAVPDGKCTLCYRCINNCPTKALTIIGRKVYSQHHYD